MSNSSVVQQQMSVEEAQKTSINARSRCVRLPNGRRLVELQKNFCHATFGIQVASAGRKAPRTFVSAIAPGSPAEQCGVLLYDRILEIGAIDVSTWSRQHVIQALSSTTKKEVSILLQEGSYFAPPQQGLLHRLLCFRRLPPHDEEMSNPERSVMALQDRVDMVHSEPESETDSQHPQEDRRSSEAQMSIQAQSQGEVQDMGPSSMSVPNYHLSAQMRELDRADVGDFNSLDSPSSSAEFAGPGEGSDEQCFTAPSGPSLRASYQVDVHVAGSTIETMDSQSASVSPRRERRSMQRSSSARKLFDSEELCYCGDMAADQSLLRLKRIGDFLLRDSSQPGLYTLTLQVGPTKAIHARIKRSAESGDFYIRSDNEFRSIYALVRHYRVHRVPDTKTKLVRARGTQPLPRNFSVGHNPAFSTDVRVVEGDRLSTISSEDSRPSASAQFLVDTDEHHDGNECSFCGNHNPGENVACIRCKRLLMPTASSVC